MHGQFRADQSRRHVEQGPFGFHGAGCFKPPPRVPYHRSTPQLGCGFHGWASMETFCPSQLPSRPSLLPWLPSTSHSLMDGCSCRPHSPWIRVILVVLSVKLRMSMCLMPHRRWMLSELPWRSSSTWSGGSDPTPADLGRLVNIPSVSKAELFRVAYFIPSAKDAIPQYKIHIFHDHSLSLRIRHLYLPIGRQLLPSHIRVQHDGVPTLCCLVVHLRLGYCVMRISRQDPAPPAHRKTRWPRRRPGWGAVSAPGTANQSWRRTDWDGHRAPRLGRRTTRTRSRRRAEKEHLGWCCATGATGRDCRSQGAASTASAARWPKTPPPSTVV